MEIKVMRNILDRNRNMANEVRKILKEKNITMINLISSPGSGKTTLLERICERLTDNLRIGVIEGDVTTDRDAQRLKRFGIPIVVINTEGGCHLDSHSIYKVLECFNLDNLDILFVENVGNLVCPTAFDLGESFRLAVLSIPEGDDKPAKYPMLFRQAKAVVLNKIDLLHHTNFSLRNFTEDLRKINPSVPIFRTSCTRGDGLDEFVSWLTEHLNYNS